VETPRNRESARYKVYLATVEPGVWACDGAARAYESSGIGTGGVTSAIDPGREARESDDRGLDGARARANALGTRTAAASR
jgi:hypothetical protein